MAPPAGGAAAKKKPAAKVNPALKLLQKRMDENRKLEEEQAAAEKEALEKIAEAERLEQEETKRKEEADAARKLRKKQQKEELKKSGQLLSDKDKHARLRNQQMLHAANIIVPVIDPSDQKRKPIYNKKKKPTKKSDEAGDAATEEKEAEPEPEPEPEQVEPEAQASESEESDGFGDWETIADAASKPKYDKKEVGNTKVETSATNKLEGPPNENKGTEELKSKSKSKPDNAEHEDDMTATQKITAARKVKAVERRKKRDEEVLAAGSKENLRSPICCILGHVDTGKTKLLDKIRKSNVQEGEAGGITQQIGATFFPTETLKQKVQVVNQDNSFEFKVPGLLVIDTPGHESFSNLRSRGSSLCNIAILVVDIMHGLEPQTLESMKLLRDRQTPFIVALNKIDRLYAWKKVDNNGFQDSLAQQNKATQQEFKDRLEKTKVAFAEHRFNSEVFYNNKSMAKYVSLVPTSAHTGEGIPDLLKLLIKLTQERMTGSLMYLAKVEATVLEVKIIEGLGTTIDVILSNGIIRERDQIVLCGSNGPISTSVRSLLTPAELRELRVKSQYVHNKEVKAAVGVKITADGLDEAIAGSRLLVVGSDDDEEEMKEDVNADIKTLMSRVSRSNRGVGVQASTLGSLEALLDFLRASEIPVGSISIGPLFKRHVMQTATMLERAKEYAVLLCFDVRVDKEAEEYAKSVGVEIFKADIIYHLYDKFTAHMNQVIEAKKEATKLDAVFPCLLKCIDVYHKTNPIVIGVDVVKGILKPLTPIAAIKQGPDGKKRIISLGRVQSIERDHKSFKECSAGQPSVAIKIEGLNQPAYGSELEEGDLLYSHISRTSIDTLKELYKEEVSKQCWMLIKKLKPEFDIS